MHSKGPTGIHLYKHRVYTLVYTDTGICHFSSQYIDISKAAKLAKPGQYRLKMAFSDIGRSVNLAAAHPPQ